MTQDILAKVADIIRDIIDNDSAVITEKTMAKDIEDWDSLNNIQIIIAIEKAFKIRFKTAEIRTWKNVGEMCNSIATYIKQ